MTPADWIAVSLSALTLIAVALQWRDSSAKAHRAELAAAESRGKFEVTFDRVIANGTSSHKRIDSLEYAFQLLREALLAKQYLTPGEMPPPSSRSRPPPPPRDED